LAFFFSLPSQSHLLFTLAPFFFLALALRFGLAFSSQPFLLFGLQALGIFTPPLEIDQALLFQPGRLLTFLPRGLETLLLFFELPARGFRLLSREPFILLLAENLGLLALLESLHLPLNQRFIHDRRFDGHEFS
jgi:hypothetical protein